MLYKTNDNFNNRSLRTDLNNIRIQLTRVKTVQV